MKNVTGLTCVICDKTYPADYAGYVCTEHGNEGILDVRYDYDTIAAEWTKEDLAANPDRTMWRYKPVMPVAPDAEVPPLTVGGTPMYDAAPLASALGIARCGSRMKAVSPPPRSRIALRPWPSSRLAR